MSSGKAFPERILFSREVAKLEFNPAVIEDFIEKTAYEDTYEEYLSLEEHSALIAEKDKEIERLRAALNYIARDMAALEIDCAHEQCDTYVMKAREALAGGKDGV